QPPLRTVLERTVAGVLSREACWQSLPWTVAPAWAQAVMAGVVTVSAWVGRKNEFCPAMTARTKAAERTKATGRIRPQENRGLWAATVARASASSVTIQLSLIIFALIFIVITSLQPVSQTA